MSKYNINPGCVAMGCQCVRCASDEWPNCCIRHLELLCPDVAGFSPDYICPDFEPRKEAENDG